jgi:hypothetical protein
LHAFAWSRGIAVSSGWLRSGRARRLRLSRHRVHRERLAIAARCPRRLRSSATQKRVCRWRTDLHPGPEAPNLTPTSTPSAALSEAVHTTCIGDARAAADRGWRPC